MGCRSVGEYMRPLHADSSRGYTLTLRPTSPLVMSDMMDEAMQAVLQRHPRSPLAAEDPVLVTVARGLTGRASVAALPDPPMGGQMVLSPGRHPERIEVINVAMSFVWLPPGCRRCEEAGAGGRD